MIVWKNEKSSQKLLIKEKLVQLCAYQKVWKTLFYELNPSPQKIMKYSICVTSLLKYLMIIATKQGF